MEADGVVARRSKWKAFALVRVQEVVRHKPWGLTDGVAWKVTLAAVFKMVPHRWAVFKMDPRVVKRVRGAMRVGAGCTTPGYVRISRAWE